MKYREISAIPAYQNNSPQKQLLPENTIGRHFCESFTPPSHGLHLCGSGEPWDCGRRISVIKWLDGIDGNGDTCEGSEIEK